MTTQSTPMSDVNTGALTVKIEVGLSITTANDEIRKAFEPHAPSIMARLRAVETLHQNGIKTYVMIAPILPEAENLIEILAGKVDSIIIGRMNYHHADGIYDKHGWSEKRTDEYFDLIKNRITSDCAESGIDCRSAYEGLLTLCARPAKSTARFSLCYLRPVMEGAPERQTRYI